MLRKIVVVRDGGPLNVPPQARAVAARRRIVEDLGKVRGVGAIGAVVAPPTPVRDGAPPVLRTVRSDALIVSVELTDEDAVERLKIDRRDEITAMFADMRIAPIAPYCGAAPVGRDTDVARRLGVAKLRKAGLTGRGVRIAVVDTGIARKGATGAGKPIKRIGDHAWHPWDPTYVGGTSPAGHGTMCAHGAQIAAPDAEILDYALLRSTDPTLDAWLSNAIEAYLDILAQFHERKRSPMVVNNSWGIVDRKDDEPEGAIGNYAGNPNHPFNDMVHTLVDAGIDVLFAAGNCGKPAPDGPCGPGDIGPGQSILGANGHRDVITVAAVTVRGDRLGCSSQGPAILDLAKPDVAAYSQFAGSGVAPADGGTSTACGVAAGVVAALRTKAKRAPPYVLRAALQRTARDVSGEGFDGDLGFGILRPVLAARALGLTVP
jgi:subtilisin family serine protease